LNERQLGALLQIEFLRDAGLSGKSAEATRCRSQVIRVDGNIDGVTSALSNLGADITARWTV